MRWKAAALGLCYDVSILHKSMSQDSQQLLVSVLVIAMGVSTYSDDESAIVVAALFEPNV
jgi:hypothetical protein